MSEPTSTIDRMPPKLSTGSVDSLTCAGMFFRTMKRATSATGMTTRKTALQGELQQQGPGDQGSQRVDGAARGRPQRDRFGAGRTAPQRRDQGETGGKRHTGGDTAEDARADQDFDRRREAGDQRGGDRQRQAEEQHHLAAVAVAERAEPEHRAGQAQRVPHRDQVELRLRGVEGRADGWQRDIRHGQRQVGDR